MEGPKVFYVMCITVVGVVYADHYENHHRKNWRHSTLDEHPSIRFEHFDKAANKATKGKFIHKPIHPSILWDMTGEPEKYTKDVFRTKSTAQPEPTTTTDRTRIQFDILAYWTAPPALPETSTTKAPIDSDKSWFLETYWETADDEPKPSWRNSVIIPIIAEPKSKLPKARVAIIKRASS